MRRNKKPQGLIHNNFDQNVDLFDSLKGALTHPDFSVDSNWIFMIKDHYARSDEKPFRRIRIERYSLPPSPLHSEPLKLTSRPRLAAYCVLAAECFYSNLPSISKSSLDNTAFVSNVVAKFLEYCWLQGFYDPRTITDDEMSSLATLLAEGGWAKALNIEERVKKFVTSKSREDLQIFRNNKKNHVKSPIFLQKLISVLGTNLSAKEVKPYVSELYRALGVQINVTKKFDRPTRSMLKHYLDPLNLLARLPEPYAFKSPLIFNTNRLAKRLGRPGSRTRNLAVEEVALLISRALFWIDEVGPLVCDGLEGLAEEAVIRKKAGFKYVGSTADKILNPLYDKLKTVLGEEAQAFNSLALSTGFSSVMVRLVTCLQVACFIIIGSMNARRRDEIAGKRIGLHRYSLKDLSPDIGVYQVHFYIEKTYRCYIPFYVNGATARAIKLLERICDAYSIVDQCHDIFSSNAKPEEISLFAVRSVNSKSMFHPKPDWFSIDDAVRMGKFSVFRGEATPSRFLPHTLRRFYAIFFYYRYENATLHGLMYQLGHTNFGSVLTYITDPVGRPEMERIEKLLESSDLHKKEAFEKHCSEVEESLREVGEEKLKDDIERALCGEASGGYAKYIRRLDIKLASYTQYINFDDRVDKLKKRVMQAGHWPNPMVHGDCLAGGPEAWRLAHCADIDERKLRVENASPVTCHKCTWHQSNIGNIRNLEEDLSQIYEKSRTEENMLLKVKARQDYENLKKIIFFHRERIRLSSSRNEG